MKIDTVPIAIMFTYKIIGFKTKKTNIYRRLKGYTDKSKNGKYTYERKGILSDLKYIKPSSNVIIIKHNDAKTLRNFFKTQKIQFSEQIIILNQNQAKELDILHDHKWQDILDEMKGSDDFMVSLDF
jgi:hypothetical protein